jgi:hypothetical protein
MAWPRAIVVAPLFCALALACAGPHEEPPAGGECTATLPDSADCGTAAPSYDATVAPLVKDHCLVCHYAGNRLSDIVLETQAQLSDRLSLVETRLYRCQMPPDDGPALSGADRQTLLKWLVCGAPDN